MRNLIITFLLLTASLIILTIFVGVSKTRDLPNLTIKKPHLYENEEISIEKISLTVFYFVPKDSLTKKRDDWKEITEPHLKNLLNFHSSQFENTSTIHYQFFPQVITGEKTAEQYESFFEHEDHDSIVPIRDEIRRRVLDKQGDLYSLLQNNVGNSDSREVFLVVFEGAGAAGNNDFALISRAYLTDSKYQTNGSTFLAHEFYHTLGIPDFYKKSSRVYENNEQVSISLITKKDIMGQVITPLSNTYIDTATLKKMGL